MRKSACVCRRSCGTTRPRTAAASTAAASTACSFHCMGTWHCCCGRSETDATAEETDILATARSKRTEKVTACAVPPARRRRSELWRHAQCLSRRPLTKLRLFGSALKQWSSTRLLLLMVPRSWPRQGNQVLRIRGMVACVRRGGGTTRPHTAATTTLRVCILAEYSATCSTGSSVRKKMKTTTERSKCSL